MESAKQAARKENTEASPPNEKGSMTAEQKRATLLTRREQDCARSVVDSRRRRENYPTKRKTPMPKTWRL